MSDLRAVIEEANRRAGRQRQKTFAKKTYLLRTDAQVVDLLCDRAEELFAAVKAKGDTRAALESLAEAVRIARKRGK